MKMIAENSVYSGSARPTIVQHGIARSKRSNGGGRLRLLLIPPGNLPRHRLGHHHKAGLGRMVDDSNPRPKRWRPYRQGGHRPQTIEEIHRVLSCGFRVRDGSLARISVFGRISEKKSPFQDRIMQRQHPKLPPGGDRQPSMGIDVLLKGRHGDLDLDRWYQEVKKRKSPNSQQRTGADLLDKAVFPGQEYPARRPTPGMISPQVRVWIISGVGNLVSFCWRAEGKGGSLMRKSMISSPLLGPGPRF